MFYIQITEAATDEVVGMDLDADSLGIVDLNNTPRDSPLTSSSSLPSRSRDTSPLSQRDSADAMQGIEDNAASEQRSSTSRSTRRTRSSRGKANTGTVLSSGEEERHVAKRVKGKSSAVRVSKPGGEGSSNGRNPRRAVHDQVAALGLGVLRAPNGGVSGLGTSKLGGGSRK